MQFRSAVIFVAALTLTVASRHSLTDSVPDEEASFFVERGYASGEGHPADHLLSDGHPPQQNHSADHLLQRYVVLKRGREPKKDGVVTTSGGNRSSIVLQGPEDTREVGSETQQKRNAADRSTGPAQDREQRPRTAEDTQEREETQERNSPTEEEGPLAHGAGSSPTAEEDPLTQGTPRSDNPQSPRREERMAQLFNLVGFCCILVVITAIILAISAIYRAYAWAGVSEAQEGIVEGAIFAKVERPNRYEAFDDVGFSREPPPMVFYVTVFAMVCRNIDLTIVMPTSLLRTRAVGYDLAESGIVLGFSGLGIMVSIPAFVKLSQRSQGRVRGFRACYILFATLSLASNLLWIFASSYEVLLAASFVKGLGSGVMASITYCFTCLTSPIRRSEYLSWISSAGLMGSALGPGIASVLWIQIADSPYRSESTQMLAPAIFMVVLMSVLLVVVIICMPSQASLEEDRNFSWSGDDSRLDRDSRTPRGSRIKESPELESLLVFRKYKVLTALIFMGMIRIIIRFGFEAGQLIVLQYQYGMSPAEAGLVILLNVGLAAMAIFVQARVTGKQGGERHLLMSDIVICGLACFMMVVPMLHAFYFCESDLGCSLRTTGGLMLFLGLSFILYTGNALTTPLANSLCTLIVPDPDRWFLNTGSIIMMIGIFCDGLASFMGPSLYRWALEQFAVQQAVLGMLTLGLISASLLMLSRAVPDDTKRFSESTAGA